MTGYLYIKNTIRKYIKHQIINKLFSKNVFLKSTVLKDAFAFVLAMVG